MMPIRSVTIKKDTKPDNCIDAAPVQPLVSATNYAWEIRLTQLFLAFTLLAWGVVSWQTGEILWHRIQANQILGAIEQSVFILIIQGLIYGNFVYQLTRIGYLRRRIEHKPLTVEDREKLYDTDAPKLAILVPSYKEELSVVQRTLISAGLQDYPNKRIVLLIDNPPEPDNIWDERALDAARALPVQLQSVFDKAAAPFISAQKQFLARIDSGKISLPAEAIIIARLYEQAAYWIEAYAKTYPVSDHADQLLQEKVFKSIADSHYERANQLSVLDFTLNIDKVRREYKRLAALFSAEFASFERKRYVNLSNESNKAMNLNSYIRLLGKSWQVIKRDDGNYLEEATSSENSFCVPSADYLITLDADSLLVPEYALVLVQEMLRPENANIAVAQTPYNTIPNPQGHLERIAGATTDIQYLRGCSRLGC